MAGGGLDALVAAGAAVLLLAWVAATVRHHRRRGASAARAEWETAEARPDLWTSGARCRACGTHGGLLELEGDETTFVCLTCGARAARDTRA